MTDPHNEKPELDDATLALANQLFDLARQGDTESLRGPLAKGLAVNIRDSNGNSLLMLASYNGHLDASKLLLEHGADPELANSRQQTPLSGAAFKGLADISQLLINHGADVNAATPDGKTPLMFAAMFNQKDIVDLLLNNGADAYAKSADGLTALALARAMGAEAAARRLAQHVELF